MHSVLFLISAFLILFQIQEISKNNLSTKNHDHSNLHHNSLMRLFLYNWPTTTYWFCSYNYTINWQFCQTQNPMCLLKNVPFHSSISVCIYKTRKCFVEEKICTISLLMGSFAKHKSSDGLQHKDHDPSLEIGADPAEYSKCMAYRGVLVPICKTTLLLIQLVTSIDSCPSIPAPLHL